MPCFVKSTEFAIVEKHKYIKMKKVTLLLFLFCSSFSFSQKPIAGKPYVMNDNKDFYFLDKILKNKKIILLGEQTYGDGATMDEKLNLALHLNRRKGKNTLVFETGMYEGYKAWKLYTANKVTTAIYNRSVYRWSNTRTFQNLLSHMERTASFKDTIKVIGFDSEEGGSLFNQYFIEDLKKIFLERQIIISDTVFSNIEKIFVQRDLNNVATNKKDSLNLYQQYNLVLTSFKEIGRPNIQEKLMEQVVLNQIAQVDLEIKKIQKQKLKQQNFRDSQMAKNLIFLSELYPEEKMICWSSSNQFANNIKDFEYTTLTDGYLKQQIEIEKQFRDKSEEIYGRVKSLEGAIPMGELLKNHFKDKLYSIAFSSYEGDYGFIGIRNYPILQPPVNSIEHQLTSNENTKVFFGFDKKDTTSYYCSALGNLPIKAKWNQVFDGLLFIKKSYPPKPGILDTASTALESFTVSGKITDKKSNKAIPNADIYLLNTNKSVVANNGGAFQFQVPRSSFNGKLIVSALGYYSDTLSVSKLENLKNVVEIQLQKFDEETIQLDGMKLAASRKKVKSLTAEKILKKVRKNIDDNYFQNPYNQKFFFRSRIKEDGVVFSNEEAVLNTYCPEGINSSSDAASNFYGNLLHFQCTTNNPSKDNWEGIGYFGVMIFTNIVLSESNVIHKTTSFNLKNEGVASYDNRNVYMVSFVNNAPDVFTTGFSNPAPKYATGMLYIDTKSFAIVKFEHYLEKYPDYPDDNSGLKKQAVLKITETYKLVGDKYFLNYSNETVENKYLSRKDNKLVKTQMTSYDMMSLDINTTNVEKMNRQIDRLKLGVVLKEDPEFWKNNNFILEDDKQEF